MEINQILVSLAKKIQKTNTRIDTIADYVVDEGIDYTGKFYYRKWNSGFAEAWTAAIETASSYTIDISYGSDYFCTISNQNMPKLTSSSALFTSVGYMNLKTVGAYGILNCSLTSVSTTSYSFYLSNSDQADSSHQLSISIMAYITGRWD